MVELTTADLHGAFEDSALNSMNFLNEVAGHYPDAIRLARSAVTPAEIDAGLDRLAALIHDELRRVHGTAELL